jgi:hypothetical protein
MSGGAYHTSRADFRLFVHHSQDKRSGISLDIYYLKANGVLVDVFNNAFQRANINNVIFYKGSVWTWLFKFIFNEQPFPDDYLNLSFHFNSPFLL